MLLEKYFGGLTHRKGRFHRAMLCAVLLLLSMQLMGVLHHQHAFNETRSDCAACYFAQNLPPDLAAASADVAPTLALVSYLLLSIPAYRFLSQPSHLIPLAQAPPPQLPPL